MNLHLFILLFLPAISFSQSHCKYDKPVLKTFWEPLSTEETGLFPGGRTLEHHQVHLETHGMMGADFTQPELIGEAAILVRYGLYRHTEFQSGLSTQLTPGLYPLYDYDQRFQAVLKQGLGEWLQTPHGGVPTVMALRYIIQGSASGEAEMQHFLGWSIQHTLYNPRWEVNFGIVQYFNLQAEFMNTISIKTVRKTRNPYFSLFAAYRDNYKAYKTFQLGFIYSDLKKYCFDVSLCSMTRDHYGLSVSLTYRI